MISVINFNCIGNKVSGVGFGIEIIDFGVFGQGIWMVVEGNIYGGFGGIFGVMFYVVGVIVLFYFVFCFQFIQLLFEVLVEVVFLVWWAIFDGVKFNLSLDSIMVIGGMFNFYNSLQMLF